MHIGLIGGIGVAATVVYYTRLTEKARARGLPLHLTIAHADVDALARNAAADDRSAQAALYSGHLAQLTGAGADCAMITSLGGHFCFAETKAIAPLPLIDATGLLDAYFQEAGIASVGVLGTRQVAGTGVYGKLERTRAIAPVDLDAVHECYIRIALAASCTPDQRAFLFDQGQKLIEAGAEVVLLGGTDLGLAFDGHDPGYKVVDAIDVHVAHLLELAARMPE